MHKHYAPCCCLPPHCQLPRLAPLPSFCLPSATAHTSLPTYMPALLVYAWTSLLPCLCLWHVLTLQCVAGTGDKCFSTTCHSIPTTSCLHTTLSLLYAVFWVGSLRALCSPPATHTHRLCLPHTLHTLLPLHTHTPPHLLHYHLTLPTTHLPPPPTFSSPKQA